MYQVIDNIIVYGDPVDQGALEQIKRCSILAEKAVLAADHHKGYEAPIGASIAFDGVVGPGLVGFDIGCGNKACRLDIPAKDVKGNIKVIMDGICANVSFGIGRHNAITVDHELFDSETWKHVAMRPLKDMARAQLGTVGSGNHFCCLFSDENGNAWIGVHFGSRGFGHKTATWFLEMGGADTKNMDAEPCLLSVHDDLGAEYLECMKLAGQYAYAGRDWVCNKIAELIGANIVEEIHNHHNYTWLEKHGGRDLYVVRKGATPAFPGQRGFVGGSMGDNSVIIEGVESDIARDSLYTTVHGAGRVMSRTQAAGKMNYRTRQRSGGQVTEHMMMDWVNKLGIELRGGGTDEAPQVYKRLPEVLAHHEDSIRILHTLSPIGVAMAGANEYDPYKD